LSVRNFFEEGLLDEIVRVKPDELAPSLGAVILAIGEGRVEEGETPYYKPSVFFELTYPSDNFISVLKSVVEALRNRGFTSIFLNLDMGSGKTHLLTLLLHLFASYTLAPKQLSDYLDDYKSKTGYDENLARKTVVFAFDLRTPRLATRYLTLTERLLRKLGSDGAAELVKSAYDHDKLPDANELAKRIDKELNLLILIDELHYAATLGDEEDKRIVAEVVKFVLDLVNYRRTLYRDASGIAIVVASSRRDFNRWLEIRDLLDPVF
jgi:Predicted ATPase (AAA+ superfamily)